MKGSFNQFVKPFFKDIRFWLLLFFVVRLIGITNPPLESGHNWRQSLTNMVARNFYEDKADIRYPTIDIAGEKSGIMTSEFPVYNYLIYGVSKLFGFNHWTGRWVNLIVSTIGLFYFHQLIIKLLNKNIAFYATLITLTSLWFAYSRKIMPDTFSVSLVFVGLYGGHAYLKEGKWFQLVLFFVFTTLGVLSKIPALSLCAGLVIVPWITSVKRARIFHVAFAGLIGLCFVWLWYFYWLPHVYAAYDYQLFFPKTLRQGFQEISTVLPNLFEKFYFSSLNSFVAFGCFLLGLFYVVKGRNRLLQLALVSISVVFAFFILKTGSVFPTHSYYIVPFAPIMALVAACFLAELPKNIGYVILGVVVIEGIANQQHDFFLRDSELYKLELESTLENVVPNDNLVIINGGTTPQNMYFAHRKGWAIRNSEVNVKFVDSLHQLGAEYLIIDKHQTNVRELQYKVVLRSEHYYVYGLSIDN
jgi:hypothetical protein